MSNVTQGLASLDHAKEYGCPNPTVPLIFSWTMTFLLLILAIIGVFMSLIGRKRRLQEEKKLESSQRMPVTPITPSAPPSATTMTTTPAQSPLLPQ